jgi:hypothetical protein
MWRQKTQPRTEMVPTSCASEANAAANEPDFRERHYVVVPPSRVRPGRQQGYHGGAVTSTQAGFSNPFARVHTIGRIHKADAFPLANQAVFGRREVAAAFRVLGDGTDVEREAELRVEFSEQAERRAPFGRLAGEGCRLALAGTVSSLFLCVRCVYFSSRHVAKTLFCSSES